MNSEMYTSLDNYISYGTTFFIQNPTLQRMVYDIIETVSSFNKRLIIFTL